MSAKNDAGECIEEPPHAGAGRTCAGIEDTHQTVDIDCCGWRSEVMGEGAMGEEMRDIGGGVCGEGMMDEGNSGSPRFASCDIGGWKVEWQQACHMFC